MHVWNPWARERGTRVLRVSPDMRHLLYGGGSSLCLERLTRREFLRSGGHGRPVLCVALAPSRQFLASGGVDQTVRIWSATSFREIYRIQAHEGLVRSIAFSGDSTRLVSGGWDGKMKVWRVSNGSEVQAWEFDEDVREEVACVDYSSNSRLLAGGSGA